MPIYLESRIWKGLEFNRVGQGCQAHFPIDSNVKHMLFNVSFHQNDRAGLAIPFLKATCIAVIRIRILSASEKLDFWTVLRQITQPLT